MTKKKPQNNQPPSNQCAEISLNPSFLITCKLITEARKKTQHHKNTCHSHCPIHSPKNPAVLMQAVYIIILVIGSIL